MRVAGLFCLLAVLAVTPAPTQLVTDRSVSFDAFIFSQEDDLGQPLKTEGFGYGGARTDVRIPLGPEAALRGNAALAWIRGDDVASLPPTIGNGTVTSASAELFTLDASLSVEVRRTGSPWTVSPGLFYHHQFGNISGGLDVGVRRELRGGDAILSLDYSLRFAYPLLRYWDGSVRGRDYVLSQNALIAWTQTLSPTWVTNLGVQLTIQQGILSDPFNYVVLYVGDTPVRLTDERLPRRRTRVQVNARVRYSPARRLAIGLDSSAYADDWSIRHRSVEPSVSFPVGRVRSRLWYRFVTQEGTRFHLPASDRARQLQTQDSDLLDFRTHGGGASMTFPVRTRDAALWETRIALFGFDRDDEIRAAGIDAGVKLSW